MVSSRPASRWRFLVSPKWLGWHAFVVLAVAGMLALGDWQLHRAEAGNALSWAYTFEWPIFAVFGVVFWIKTIRDEVHPPAQLDPAAAAAVLPEGTRPAAAAGSGPVTADGPVTEEDEELAAYNAYLARLHSEVKGHGRWHGLR
jgi:hypothetical protein